MTGYQEGFEDNSCIDEDVAVVKLPVTKTLEMTIFTVDCQGVLLFSNMRLLQQCHTTYTTLIIAAKIASLS